MSGKKIFVFITIFALCLMMYFIASAEVISYTKDDVTASLDTVTHTLTFAGEGEAFKLLPSEYMWEEPSPYSQEDLADVKKVVLENGISSIGRFFSEYIPKVKTVSMPDTLTSIGFSAFYYWEDMKELTLPASVVSVGGGWLPVNLELLYGTTDLARREAEAYSDEDHPIQYVDLNYPVYLNVSEVTCYPNMVTQLTPSRVGLRTEASYTWKSSNSKVVKVDGKGKATALKAGTAKVTVTAENGQTATCTFTVQKPLKITLLRVLYEDESYYVFSTYEKIQSTEQITVNGTMQIRPYSGSNYYEQNGFFLSDDDDHGMTYTYKSSNTQIATVSATGLIKGKKKGNVTITVTSSAGATASFKVHVISDGSKITSVDEKVNWVVENYTNSSMSTFEKVKALHDWLIYNAHYDLTYVNHGANGVLLLGTGVCESYARAYRLLLTRAGIENIYISGSARSGLGYEGHAWNMVKIGSDWYHVDCTWDDPLGSVNDNLPVSGNEGYSYFLTTDSYIARDHRWNSSTKATSKKYNWLEVKKSAAIKSITQEAGTSHPVITWSAAKVAGPGATGISSYQVYRSDKKDSGFEYVGEVDADFLTYTDTTATAGKTYYYRLNVNVDYKQPFEKRINLHHIISGIASNENSTAFTTLKKGPAVSKLSQSSDGVKITWKKVSGISDYGVLRAEEKGGPYTLVGHTNKTTYTDKTAGAGQTYYYAIGLGAKSGKKAYYGEIGTPKSIKIKAASKTVELPAAPGKVQWKKLSAEGMNALLSWNKVEGADGYVVYRAASKDGQYTRIKTTKKTSLSDTPDKKGTWYYKVRAYTLDADGKKHYGKYSAVESIKVKKRK